jgi:hypothetical protein
MPLIPDAALQRRFKSKVQTGGPRAKRQNRFASLRCGLMTRIVWRKISSLKPFAKNPRRHPEAQIAALMKSIGRIWTMPILIDENGTILAGHLRLEVAKRLGMTEVPTIKVVGLSENEKRAVVIADDRIPEQAIWNFDLLREHTQRGPAGGPDDSSPIDSTGV